MTFFYPSGVSNSSRCEAMLLKSSDDTQLVAVPLRVVEGDRVCWREE